MTGAGGGGGGASSGGGGGGATSGGGCATAGARLGTLRPRRALRSSTSLEPPPLRSSVAIAGHTKRSGAARSRGCCRLLRRGVAAPRVFRKWTLLEDRRVRSSRV